MSPQMIQKLPAIHLLEGINLDGYDALRSAVLMRTFVFMIGNTAKENEKM